VVGIEMIAIHPIDSKALKVSLRIIVAKAVSIGKGSRARHDDTTPTYLLHHTHRLPHTLGTVGRNDIGGAAM